MPRFYFNVGDSLDDEGREFATLADAKCKAVTFAGSSICDKANEFWDAADFSLTVTNEKGLILFTFQCFGIEAPAIRTGALKTL